MIFMATEKEVQKYRISQRGIRIPYKTKLIFYMTNLCEVCLADLDYVNDETRDVAESRAIQLQRGLPITRRRAYT